MGTSSRRKLDRSKYKPPPPLVWDDMSGAERLKACREQVKYRRVLSAKMAKWLLSKFKQTEN